MSKLKSVEEPQQVLFLSIVSFLLSFFDFSKRYLKSIVCSVKPIPLSVWKPTSQSVPIAGRPNW